MTEASNLLTRLKGSKWVYLRHMKNMERSILDEIGTFSCENEEQTTKLTGLKNGLLEKIDKVKEIDQKILDILPQEESEKKLEDILVLEDLNFELLAKIDRYLKKTPPSPSLSLLDISNQGSAPRPTQIQDVRIKVPKLELSKFDGDIINWQGFWDQFLIAIHENDSLADIDKFSYLKSFLSDSALQSINGLSLNVTNYKEAIEILHEWYKNKQVLINAHMQLDKLSKTKSSNDINELREMYDQIEVCVRNLKALNIDIVTYGAILVPFLNGKLPPKIKVILSRNFQNDIWQLDGML